MNWLMWWHVGTNELFRPLLGNRRAQEIEWINRRESPEQAAIHGKLLRRIKSRTVPRVLITAMLAWKAAIETCQAAAEHHSDGVQVHIITGFSANWSRNEISAYRAAEATRFEAERAYKLVAKACQAEMEELHAAECPNCPWDGTTIFPQVKPAQAVQ